MRKIADLVLRDPNGVVDLSITDIAKRAGTSPASVTRFCRELGYDSFMQFRVALASDRRTPTAQSWQTDIGTDFSPNDPPARVLDSLLNAQRGALELTAAASNLEDLVTVAKRIWGCRRLDIYGLVGSGLMADELRSRLHRIGVDAHSWVDVHRGLASAAILTDADIGIGISSSGTTEETYELLATARATGAFTVAITSNVTSPLADIADICLAHVTPQQNHQPDDLAARHSQLFVLDLLYLFVAQQDPDIAADRLAASREAVSTHRQPLRRTVRRTRSRRAAESTSTGAQ